MLRQRFLQNRADRIAAAGRIVLAASAAIAALLDPPSPAVYGPLVVRALAGYLALAVGFAVLVWIRPLTVRPLGGWAHAVDVGLVAALVYFTTGASSPFFPLFLFAILSATLKWSWRGALWTSGVVFVLFLPTGFVHSADMSLAHDDLSRFVVRSAQVLVVGGLLAYFGAQRERVWDELLRLSRPVDSRGAVSLDDWIVACLRHVGGFFEVQRVIFAWEGRDDPDLRALELDGYDVKELAWGAADGPLVARLDEGAFDFDSAASGAHLYSDGSLTALAESPFNRELAWQWNISEAVVVSVNSDALRGWLIIAKRPQDEDLHLARALAVQVAAALDHAAAEEAWRAAAAGEERIRLARDLHDGILQFLAGLSIQLKLIQREAGADPAAATARVARLEDALRAEQQDLRAFIEGLRPRSAPQPMGGARLRSLCQLLSHQWDIAIDAAEIAEPPPGIAAEVRQIVREATANAVRHGRARTIRVAAVATEGNYAMDLIDDGRGFGRDGLFDADDLRAAGFGPRSLLERVERLGGRLLLESAATGARLSITLPLGARLPA